MAKNNENNNNLKKSRTDCTWQQKKNNNNKKRAKNVQVQHYHAFPPMFSLSLSLCISLSLALFFFFLSCNNAAWPACCTTRRYRSFLRFVYLFISHTMVSRFTRGDRRTTSRRGVSPSPWRASALGAALA